MEKMTICIICACPVSANTDVIEFRSHIAHIPIRELSEMEKTEAAAYVADAPNWGVVCDGEGLHEQCYNSILS